MVDEIVVRTAPSSGPNMDWSCLRILIRCWADSTGPGRAATPSPACPPSECTDGRTPAPAKKRGDASEMSETSTFFLVCVCVCVLPIRPALIWRCLDFRAKLTLPPFVCERTVTPIHWSSLISSLSIGAARSSTVSSGSACGVGFVGVGGMERC